MRSSFSDFPKVSSNSGLSLLFTEAMPSQTFYDEASEHTIQARLDAVDGDMAELAGVRLKLRNSLASRFHA